MICKKCLELELKNIPSYIATACAEGNYDDALESEHSRRTLEWVLSEDDCQKRRPNRGR